MVHHSAWFRRLGSDEELPKQLLHDYATATIDAAERAMLDYASKVTREPAAVTQADVDGLKAHGFSDGAVLDICQVTSYFAYANRLADGLGVELE